jgi:hypothetical protein
LPTIREWGRWEGRGPLRPIGSCRPARLVQRDLAPTGQCPARAPLLRVAGSTAGWRLLIDSDGDQLESFGWQFNHGWKGGLRLAHTHRGLAVRFVETDVRVVAGSGDATGLMETYPARTCRAIPRLSARSAMPGTRRCRAIRPNVDQRTVCTCRADRRPSRYQSPARAQQATQVPVPKQVSPARRSKVDRGGRTKSQRFRVGRLERWAN